MSNVIEYKMPPRMNAVFDAQKRVSILYTTWEQRENYLKFLWSKDSYNKKGTKSFIYLYRLFQPLHAEIANIAKALGADLNPIASKGLRVGEWYSARGFSAERIRREMGVVMKILETFVKILVGREQKVIDSVVDLPVVPAKEWDTCSVCIEEFTDVETMIVFPCGHKFHPDCVKDWVLGMPFCPADRKSIVSE